MGKKAVKFSKRKRKACLIQQCKNMTKKRKQLYEQRLKSKAIDSSVDLSENETMTADKNNKDLCNIERSPKATTEKRCIENSDSPDTKLESETHLRHQQKTKIRKVALLQT